MATKAKTIKMLLYDGSLRGVTNISDSAWAIGNMYSAPRESINALITKADCKKYGVYLLLSDKQVYVGDNAFSSCQNLKKAVVPKVIKSLIEDCRVFHNCRQLTDIEYV